MAKTRRSITYRLLPAQTKVYLLEKKYKAFIGGIGSGKTWFGAWWSVQQLNGVGDGMILAPTYRMLEDVTQRQFIDFLDAHNIQYVHETGKSRVRTSSGYVFLRSAEHPERLRGTNLAWAWGDEAALWRVGAFKILLGRLRKNDARALLTTTPAGFNWVYEYLEELQSEQFGYVIGSTRENVHLDNEFVSSLEEAYTAEYAAQEIDGQFVAFEGLVYPEVRDGVHIIEPFDIPSDWRRYRGIDFGFVNPFVCLWAAVDHDGRIYFYREHYKTKTLLVDHARMIKAADVCNDQRDVVRYSQTVADHDTQDVAELRSHGIATTKARKSVSVGIQKVKARLAVQADGKPRMFFFSSLVHTRKELRSYRWSDKALKDEPIKESDHAMDAMRYIVMAVDGPKVGVRIV